MQHAKLYQDQLYGAKVLSPLAVAIIDTPEFQRLAGLRQLGFADTVYRGARHTRFEHSVGAYFIARTLMRRIVQNHERLDLDHPGKNVSTAYRQVPSNSDLQKYPEIATYQSRWRGLTEVVSAAALLHDLGHVPFGHTLEDEFAGLYMRHDRLAGARFYEMLFNPASELAQVFTVDRAWLEGIPNHILQRLIYVILSWKDDVETATGFAVLVVDALRKAQQAVRENVPGAAAALTRLQLLLDSYESFQARELFQPFMSDVVGNTICADLLDYLPRDRMNLGMEPRLHTRLQRYLTIRPGTLYPDEGLRVSIMVTRRGRGGQRRDVATAVLDIMRERYEMAERVFYHHKKSAMSAMLAKLVELAKDRPSGDDRSPRDDDSIYPAPWQTLTRPSEDTVPHMAHLSDAEFIDYLGRVPYADPATQTLQRRLHAALRVRRNAVYRTLLVIDTDVPAHTKHTLDRFTFEFRGPKDAPSSAGRRALERRLASAVNADDGEIIIYCPAAAMQAKEVDARLEIDENRVLPLRVQTESFVYFEDVKVLNRYYAALWRSYVFVAPEIYKDASRCKIIVDIIADLFSIPKWVAYKKVRGHRFAVEQTEMVGNLLRPVTAFVERLPFESIPRAVFARLLAEAAHDAVLTTRLVAGEDCSQRLSALFHVAILRPALEDSSLVEDNRTRIRDHIQGLIEGASMLRTAALEGDWNDYHAYARELFALVIRPEQLEL